MTSAKDQTGKRNDTKNNAASVVSIVAPTAIEARQFFMAAITIRNTGGTTWGEGNYGLGSQRPQDTDRWGVTRIPVSRPIAPGEEATFSLKCTAPPVIGQYAFDWRMVQEMVEWFGETAQRIIQVVSPIPPPTADAQDIKSVEVFNTGPYLADGVRRTQQWRNTTSRPVRILSTYLWTGVNMGGKMDTHVEVRRDRDGTYLNLLAWDHYADPVAPNHGRMMTYAPGHLLLEPDETITIAYFSNPAGPAVPAHHVCTIWFVYGT